MVSSDGGQLYTIEGFAAALIMIITAFLVVNATSVYTAGDTHISDMQLEVLGTDALMMMDTPSSFGEETPLQGIIENTPVGSLNTTFNPMFLNFTNVSGVGPAHDIQFVAAYTCRNSTNSTTTNPISYSRNLTGGEHSVKATHWVIVDPKPGINICGRNVEQAVLVEVLLWRD